MRLVRSTAAVILLAALGMDWACAEEPGEEPAGRMTRADLRDEIDAALLAPPEDAARFVRPARELWPIGGAKWVSPWSFEAGLAASAARGNTDTVDVLFDTKIGYERGRIAMELKAAYVYGEASGTKSAENLHIQARMERTICGRSYAFGKYNFDRDVFADLEYRHTAILGYGRTLIDRQKTKLKAELGGGSVWEERVGRSSTWSPSAYLGMKFNHEWGDGKTFDLDYDFVPYLNEFDLSYMTWDAKFGTPLCQGLDLTVGIRVGWVFEPPAPTKPVDLLMAVGLRLKL